jgi:hypothetical protein
MRKTFDDYMKLVLENLLGDGASEIRFVCNDQAISARALISGAWHETLPFPKDLMRAEYGVKGDLHDEVRRWLGRRASRFSAGGARGMGSVAMTLTWTSEVVVYATPAEPPPR